MRHETDDLVSAPRLVQDFLLAQIEFHMRRLFFIKLPTTLDPNRSLVLGHLQTNIFSIP